MSLTNVNKLEKIYVESLDPDFKHKFFKSSFMWRYRMGQALTTEMIEIFNNNINSLLKLVKT